MKLAAILLILFMLPLLQAKPTMVKRQTNTLVDSMVQSFITDKNYEGLCNFIKQLHDLMKDAKDDGDRNVLQQGLENIRKATESLENFQCQEPVVVSLITTTEKATTEKAIIEDILTIGSKTDSPPLKIEQGMESMCEDCEVDYEVKDENREEFAQVLDEVDVQEIAGYKPKVIALFSFIGICGFVLIGILLFTCVKMVSCLF